jgi:hypothetical protein
MMNKADLIKLIQDMPGDDITILLFTTRRNGNYEFRLLNPTSRGKEDYRPYLSFVTSAMSFNDIEELFLLLEERKHG